MADIVSQETQGQALDRADVAARWHDFDALVFIGAMGICVRTIAPCLEDKHTDPAVVCIDSTGRHVVAVVSGHVGGANELATRLAAALGVEPVVTTQSDNQQLWALDTLAQRFGWAVAADVAMNKVIFDFVNRRPTALLIDAHDAGTDYLRQTMPDHVRLVRDVSEAADCRLLIIVSPYVHAIPEHLTTIQFIPRVLTAGFGLAHRPDDYRDIVSQMHDELRRHGIRPEAVREWCTIDVKADEPFIGELHEPVRFFTADELARIDVPTPSATVERHVGTPSVSEAAAILGSNGGHLILNKIKGRNWTLAISIEAPTGAVGGLPGPSSTSSAPARATPTSSACVAAGCWSRPTSSSTPAASCPAS